MSTDEVPGIRNARIVVKTWRDEPRNPRMWNRYADNRPASQLTMDAVAAYEQVAETISTELDDLHLLGFGDENAHIVRLRSMLDKLNTSIATFTLWANALLAAEREDIDQ